MGYTEDLLDYERRMRMEEMSTIKVGDWVSRKDSREFHGGGYKRLVIEKNGSWCKLLVPSGKYKHSMTEKSLVVTSSYEDQVNSPPHYNRKGIECIQAIEASMSEEQFKGYLKGNVMKYLWRYEYKGHPKQDLEKARWYLNKLLDII